MRYLVVVEETATGFSAYSPDLPGCVATGGTRDEAQHLIADAISFHVEGMRAEGLTVPEPHASSAYVDVPA
jgi:predicted RNase H-like HicB family nuclease